MPRRARLVVPGAAHHITQRGNNRQDVFDTAADRRIFLDLLAKYAQMHSVSILGYCLMTNHYHLVLVPKAEDSLARSIGRLEADFARYVNVRRGAAGHLWQARYFSVPMGLPHRARALAYMERNPVRAGLVSRAEDYAWSSAAARLGVSQAPPWLDLSDWQREWTANEWRVMLRDTWREEEFRAELLEATLGGHPLGADFRARLESQLGRRLGPGKVGRPPKRSLAAMSTTEIG